MALVTSELTPMLCSLVSDPIDSADWIYEPKLDGLRVLVSWDGKTLDLVSRNHNCQNFQFPEIVEALKRCLKSSVVLDGEIVCLDKNGQSSFRALQQRFHLTDAQDVKARAKEFPAYLYVFDILRLKGDDLTSLSLKDRKRRLKRAVKWNNTIRMTPGTVRDGSKLLQKTCARHGEGIVGKRLDSRYVFGRSGDWIKVKCSGRQEFVIGGFTEPQRSRVGLGALLVGYYDSEQNFHYAGKVGTGFNKNSLLDLRKQLDKLEVKTNPFEGNAKPKLGKVHWVKPKLVAEIAFAEWTQNDLLRQPRFEGLRMDKKPTAVRRERAVLVPQSRSRRAATDIRWRARLRPSRLRG